MVVALIVRVSWNFHPIHVIAVSVHVIVSVVEDRSLFREGSSEVDEAFRGKNHHKNCS
jgi:hypothetical protein